MNEKKKINALNSPSKVIVHCAASSDTKGEVKFSFEDCRNYHVIQRGWKDIGYHWYIDRQGILYKGRDEAAPGAHCLGQNFSSIGVCYEGTYLPTPAQVKTFCDLYRQIRSIHGIEWSDWRPHNEFSNKECPGFDVSDLRDIFKKLA